ncbi:hypothetical protein [Pantoea sp. Z09]|uniref:hypothetical protein n=1 Tax=Pantoea sp. Z09 TaxID=2886821 RepID=UPI001EFE98F1|nr:hypothetical protein [Pantoea sp. Z09]
MQGWRYVFRQRRSLAGVSTRVVEQRAKKRVGHQAGEIVETQAIFTCAIATKVTICVRVVSLIHALL